MCLLCQGMHYSVGSSHMCAMVKEPIYQGKRVTKCIGRQNHHCLSLAYKSLYSYFRLFFALEIILKPVLLHKIN